jgi:hypothetical protein
MKPRQAGTYFLVPIRTLIRAVSRIFLAQNNKFLARVSKTWGSFFCIQRGHSQWFAGAK